MNRSAAIAVVLLLIAGCGSDSVQEDTLKARKLIERFSDDLEDRHALAEQVAEIGDPAEDPLIEALGHKNPKVRYFAAAALGKMKPKRAFPEIFKAFKYDEDDHVRQMAYTAVIAVGDEAVDPLIKELNDDSNDVVILFRSALALGDLRHRKAVPHLIRRLEHEAWQVRNCATVSLGKLGDLRAMKPLIVMLEQNHPRIAPQAHASLRDIIGKDLGKDPKAWREWLEK